VSEQRDLGSLTKARLGCCLGQKPLQPSRSLPPLPFHNRRAPVFHIEKINGPKLFQYGASPAEYSAGLRYAIDKGWLFLHESGTFVRFTPAGAELFA
jgi:hypothetical protein